MRTFDRLMAVVLLILAGATVAVAIVGEQRRDADARADQQRFAEQRQALEAEAERARQRALAAEREASLVRMILVGLAVADTPQERQAVLGLLGQTETPPAPQEPASAPPGPPAGPSSSEANGDPRRESPPPQSAPQPTPQPEPEPTPGPGSSATQPLEDAADGAGKALDALLCGLAPQQAGCSGLPSRVIDPTTTPWRG